MKLDCMCIRFVAEFVRCSASYRAIFGETRMDGQKYLQYTSGNTTVDINKCEGGYIQCARYRPIVTAPSSYRLSCATRHVHACRNALTIQSAHVALMMEVSSSVGPNKMTPKGFESFNGIV